MTPMPAPPEAPIKPYIIAGKVQYRGPAVTGATIWVENETKGVITSFVSSQADSNFAYNIANIVAYSHGDIILIAATHNGRRGQIRVTVDTAQFGQDVGTIALQAHWGCV